MKTILAAIITATFLVATFPVPPAQAKSVHVGGYTKKNGTHVSPHTRNKPSKKHR